MNIDLDLALSIIKENEEKIKNQEYEEEITLISKPSIKEGVYTAVVKDVMLQKDVDTKYNSCDILNVFLKIVDESDAKGKEIIDKIFITDYQKNKNYQKFIMYFNRNDRNFKIKELLNRVYQIKVVHTIGANNKMYANVDEILREVKISDSINYKKEII